jgi:hypothetical protein
MPARSDVDLDHSPVELVFLSDMPDKAASFVGFAMQFEPMYVIYLDLQVLRDCVHYLRGHA